MSRAIADAKVTGEMRLRLETVDQVPLVADAEALTLRTRIGLQTGKVAQTSLLIEGVANVPLGNRFNSTTNGRTAYPVVADPENYALNRLQLVNTALPATTMTLGRQRLNLDDQRFVGSVGWRQNEQTFDALRIVNRSLPKITLDLSYANQVNRVFGREGRPGANAGRFHGDTWLANAALQTPMGKLSTFAYLVDLDELPLASRNTETFGVRFAGEKPLTAIKLAYVLSYANQGGHDYSLGELNATWHHWNAGGGVETLQGNGATAFSAPLGTLHKFQGWADKFLTTPVDGIRDVYANAGYAAREIGPLSTLALVLAWHRFDSERLSIDYGDELDVQLQGTWRRLTGLLKYADYQAARTTPLSLRDTRKLWAQVEFAW